MKIIEGSIEIKMSRDELIEYLLMTSIDIFYSHERNEGDPDRKWVKMRCRQCVDEAIQSALIC